MSKKYLTFGSRVTVNTSESSTRQVLNNRRGTIAGPENCLYPVTDRFTVMVPITFDVSVKKSDDVKKLSISVPATWLKVNTVKSRKMRS